MVTAVQKLSGILMGFCGEELDMQEKVNNVFYFTGLIT